MTIYLTKHAIQRFYERFPKEWKKYGCKKSEDFDRDMHNLNVVKDLFNNAKEIKNIYNYQGKMIDDVIRHGKSVKFYLNDGIIFVADDERIYTILRQQDMHSSHLRNARVHNKHYTTQERFLEAVEMQEENISYKMVLSLDNYYDLVEASYDRFQTYVKRNKNNHQEIHLLSDEEVLRAHQVVAFHHLPSDVVHQLVNNTENLELIGDHQYGVIHLLDDIDMYIEVDKKNKNIRLLNEKEIDVWKLRIYHEDYSDLPESARIYEQLKHGPVILYPIKGNYCIFYNEKFLSYITGSDFQLFNAVKSVLKLPAMSMAEWVNLEKNKLLLVFNQFLLKKLTLHSVQLDYLYETYILDNSTIMMDDHGHWSWHNDVLFNNEEPRVLSESYVGIYKDVLYYYCDNHRMYFRMTNNKRHYLPDDTSSQAVKSLLTYISKVSHQKNYTLIGGSSLDKVIISINNVAAFQEKYFDTNNRLHYYAYLDIHNNHVSMIPPSAISHVSNIIEKGKIMMRLFEEDKIFIESLHERTFNHYHVLDVKYKQIEKDVSKTCYIINNNIAIYE